MRPPIPLPRRTPSATRWIAALAIGLAVVTCRDNPVAPRSGGGGRASLAIRPVIAQHVDLAGFGLTIDSLRVVVVHAPADTLRDTTAYFNPDSSQVHLGLSVLLSQPSETLSVSLSLLAAGVPVYRARASRFQLAAFETQAYLAFVISDLPEESNLQLATALAPSVRGFLSHL